MRIILQNVLLFLLFLPIISKAQDYGGAVTTAPSLGFTAPDKSLEGLSNAVNLFNGEVSFPVSLASVGDIELAASYSTISIDETFTTWNKDAPTGILGLGWNFTIPQIIVDNKATGSRHDDDFYMLDNGVTSQLIIKAISSGVWYFKTRQFSNWVIKYFEANERWEILKEDGTLFIYGDEAKNPSQFTLQYQVKWGNWIGNSCRGNQEQHVIIWNLAEIKNLWGHTIDYAYDNVSEDVRLTIGETGRFSYTKASYLSRVYDNWGNYLLLKYAEKIYNSNYVLPGDNVEQPIYEYEDPHDEINEPDAYQERFDTRYLTGVEAYTNDGFLYETKLTYDFKDTGFHSITPGYTVKRFLTSIEKISAKRNSLWKITFNYSDTDGYLQSVYTNEGGRTEFTYSNVEVGRADLNTVINAPPADAQAPSGYSLANSYFQENYVVTVWRAWNGNTQSSGNSYTIIKVYTWDGRWIERTLLSNSADASPETHFLTLLKNDNQQIAWQITFQKDFFAILVGSSLRIYSLSNKLPGEWTTFYQSVSFVYNARSLVSGDEFVAASFNSVLDTYVKNSNDGSEWSHRPITIVGQKAVSGRNNFIIVQRNNSPEQLVIYYLDQLRRWQSKSAPVAGLGSGSNNSAIYASNSTAVLIVDGNDYLLAWDKDYNATVTPCPVNLNVSDSRVISFESMLLYIGSPGSQQKVMAFRFDGVNWAYSGEKNHDATQFLSASISVSEDIFTWHTSSSQTNTNFLYHSEFDPNSSFWKNDYSWGTSTTQFACFGLNYFSTDNAIFSRDNTGSWIRSGNADGINIQTITSPFFAISAFETSDSGIKFLKNGDVNGSFRNGSYILGTYKNDINYPASRVFLAGSSSFATFARHPIRKLDVTAITSLQLYKFINYEVNGKKHHKQVTRVSYKGDADLDLQYVSIDYNELKTRYDPSGKTAQYGMVTVYPVNNDTDAFGKTNYYFFNGLSEAELSDDFDGDASSQLTNSSANVSLLTGQIFRKEIYDNSSVAVSVSTNLWNINSSETIISSGIINGTNPTTTTGTSSISYFPQLSSTRTTEFSMQSKTDFSYHPDTKQVISKMVYTKTPTSAQLALSEEYTYYWSVYDPTRSKNLLTPIIQTTQKRNSIAIASHVTKWISSPCFKCDLSYVLTPSEMYSWRKVSNADFTPYWKNTDPNNNWKIDTKVLSVDPMRGIPIEVSSSSGVINSSILFPGKGWLVAAIENASLGDVYYNGFEMDFSGVSYQSKTGTKSHVGSFNATIPHPGSFVLTYWRKVGSAAWELVESTVNANTIIGGVNTLIDEVRIYPAQARLTTYSYDRNGNIITTCDENNLITYQEYDDMQRKKLTRDKDGNILEYFQYNKKNQQ